MSIAEFMIEHGGIPGLSWEMDPLVGQFAYEEEQSLPAPQTNKAWRTLYKKIDENLAFAKGWEGDKKGPIVVGPAPSGMHSGALAPKWVFEAVPRKDEPDDMNSYQRRLICALTGRFVCISRPDSMEDEKLQASQGKPQVGVRYWWRYWDNERNVYEDPMVKCRWEERDTDGVGMFGDRTLPGDFSKGDSTWMRIPSGYDSWTNQPMGKCFTDTSPFWDNIWHWKHQGTTFVPTWDQCLVRLAELAGVPSNQVDEKLPLSEKELDRIASLKGWEKLSTSQPDMASYRKDDSRLNFYLSTGTVGSRLDHPKQGKTQLFRRKVTDPSSLFDNPRQHTGKGYHTKGGEKKRKAESAP